MIADGGMLSGSKNHSNPSYGPERVWVWVVPTFLLHPYTIWPIVRRKLWETEWSKLDFISRNPLKQVNASSTWPCHQRMSTSQKQHTKTSRPPFGLIRPNRGNHPHVWPQRTFASHLVSCAFLGKGQSSVLPALQFPMLFFIFMVQLLKHKYHRLCPFPPPYTKVTVEQRKLPRGVRNGTADYYPAGVNESLYEHLYSFFSHWGKLPAPAVWWPLAQLWNTKNTDTILPRKGSKTEGENTVKSRSHNCLSEFDPNDP